jgi:phosphoserine phosphatase RsbX
MGKVETSLIEWGVAALTLPGQSRSGDRQAVLLFPGGALVAVVDGLGHGELAAVPAETAIEVLERYARESVVALIQRCHERLRGTRGAVMSLASFREADSTMTWLGVGNVMGILLRAGPNGVPRKEYLSLRGGVVGDQLPRLDASVIPVTRGDTLILASDGIRSDFIGSLRLGESPQRVADRILAEFAPRTDDALVLVARYGK